MCTILLFELLYRVVDRRYRSSLITELIRMLNQTSLESLLRRNSIVI
jgi:hypothetical protein